MGLDEYRIGCMKNLVVQNISRLLVVIFPLCAVSCAFAGIVKGKTYVISPAGCDRSALFVENSSPDDGAAVVLWTDTRVPAQQWRAVKNKNGTFSFVNVYTGKYLSVGGDAAADGAVLVQVAGNGAGAEWTAEPQGKEKDSYVLLKNTDGKRFALVADGSNDGTRLFLSEQGTDIAKANCGVWRFVETEPITEFTESIRDEMAGAWLRHHRRERGGGLITFGDGGGWGDAEMLEVMLDAYETTGNREYIDAFEDMFGFFRERVGDNWLHLVYKDGYKWFGHDFNDDVMWMVIASARAYRLTDKEIYRKLAVDNFDAVYRRAYNRWGMMRWAEKSGHPNGTNSCINGPAEVAACYIAQSLDTDSLREKYFEIARGLYENQRRYLFVEQTGQVLDCFTWNAETDVPEKYNRWVSTYNQGTMLGAAIMLYKRYGNEKYKRDADKIVECTRRELCNGHGVVKVCQTIDGDLCGFKGILMRYLREYIVEMQHPELVEWLKNNAFHAFNNRNSRGMTWSAWLTKSTENWISSVEKDDKGNYKSYFNCAFGNSTAVSAAVNVPFAAAQGRKGK